MFRHVVLSCTRRDVSKQQQRLLTEEVDQYTSLIGASRHLPCVRFYLDKTVWRSSPLLRNLVLVMVGQQVRGRRLLASKPVLDGRLPTIVLQQSFIAAFHLPELSYLRQQIGRSRSGLPFH